MPTRLEAIDGASWETFLAASWSVLVLGKSDCEHCASYTEELHTFLAEDATYHDVRFGKMLLDRGDWPRSSAPIRGSRTSTSSLTR